MPRSSVILFALATTLTAAEAADWGMLKGRITFTGEVPEAERLEITRDEEVCGPLNLVDESLVVNPNNRGIQNVVVWLSSRKAVPIHPSFPANPKPAQLDNRDCRFVPRLVRLRTNQTLRSISTDPISHNIAVYARRNTPFSEVIPDGKAVEKSFAKEELMPIRVDCSTHAWMRAYLVITEHPYSAVTDKDGKFEIPNLPYGEWEFRFWHERVSYLPTLNIGGQVKELSRGRLEITIDQPETSLPPLSVAQLNAE